MTLAARIALAVGVLALAVLVAMLPRTKGDDTADGRSGEEDRALASVRTAVDLRPCPVAAKDAEPVNALRGVRAMCLADGGHVDVGKALAGKTTLINVWATWCEPCKTELVVLEKYASSADAVDVLAVQVDSSAVGGLEMLDDLGVRLPSLHDGKGRGPIRSALSTPGALPASYLVTAEGEVEFIENPRLFRSVDEVRTAVAEYGGTS